MKRKIDYKEVIKETVECIEDGLALLVSVDKRGKPNPMTIGWGSVGEIWNIPIFIVLVRPSRYTYSLIEQTGDFTVNICDESMKEITMYCGTVSGRDYDKFKEKKLTPLKSEFIKSPIIKECKINFECRVVAKTDLLPEFLADEIKESAYKNGDYHRLYFGEILSCYKSI